MSESAATVALSNNPVLAWLSAIAPFTAALLPGAAAETATTSVFWSGAGTQAAAETWAAANGGTTLSLAAGASEAEATAASVNFAAQASGNVVVFQSVQGVPVAGYWAQSEFNTLMSTPSVTGFVYKIIDDFGSTVCSVFCPK